MNKVTNKQKLKLKKRIEEQQKEELNAMRKKLAVTFTPRSASRFVRTFYNNDDKRIERKEGGELHCITGPALNVKKQKGLYITWFNRGIIHRYYGPAVNWGDNTREFFVNYSTKRGWVINGKYVR